MRVVPVILLHNRDPSVRLGSLVVHVLLWPPHDRSYSLCFMNAELDLEVANRPIDGAALLG